MGERGSVGGWVFGGLDSEKGAEEEEEDERV